MIKLTSQEFAQQVEHLVNQTAEEHSTVLIRAKKGNAVMISEEDWNSINDILQVVSMSGIAESLRQGLQGEIDATADHID